MAWNKPGEDKQKDPWGKKDNKSDTPPELDKVFAELNKKLNSLLGSKKKNEAPQGGGLSTVAISLFFILLLTIWGLAGIFVVDPAERAVIQRFGKYVETVGPGLHWIPPVISKKTIVNEEEISNYSYASHMLTQDENIVSVAVAVQYRIGNAKDYLFNVQDPTESIRQATASALRQVVGHTTLDDILTKGREQVRQEVAKQLEHVLSLYKAGLLLTNVAMQPARPPEQVKDAFDDAIKAQEDEQRFINQAQAYKMQVEPIARGNAARILRAAKAYEEEVILQAQGETARFAAILPEYKKAPNVMKTRMYLSVMEDILGRTPKVLLDVKNNNSLVYLPLDQLMKKQEGAKKDVVQVEQKSAARNVLTAPSTQTSTTTRITRDDIPNRMGRG